MTTSTPHHNHRRERTTRRRRTTAAAALALALTPLPLRASELYYVGPDNGNWNDPLHWSTSPTTPSGAGVPTPDDDAELSPSTDLRVILDPDYTTEISFLDLNATSGATVTLSQSSGTLTDWGTWVGITGRGSFSQTGGLHHTYGNLTLGDSPGSAGTYSLANDASLALNGDIFVGNAGAGTFVQTGGTVTPADGSFSSLYIGFGRNAPGGTYSLSGTASLTISGNELVGNDSPGTFVQTGGVNTVGSSLSVDNNGSYTLANDASLHVAGDEFYGGVAGATFTQTGGTHTLGGDLLLSQDVASTASYSLSGNNSLFAVGGNEDIAAGAFTQSAGTHTVAADLSVADGGSYVSGRHLFSTGSYSLSGTASLAVSGDERVGNSADTGVFTQSGGANAVAGSLYVGVSGVIYYDPTLGSTTAYSTGSYSLSGTASLSVTGDEFIGYHGATGAFTQSGGTHSITGTLTLAAGAAPNGTLPTASYTLSAGSLSASATTLNFNALFQFTGGSASLGALTLTGSSRLLLSPGHDKTLLASSLSLAPTAQLDLADNTLILSSTAPDTLRSFLLARSLFSSAADPTHRLAYTLSGEPTAPTSLTVTLALTGDANLDGRVDADDYALLDRSYARNISDAHWSNGDFNYDGLLDQNDYLLIDTTLGQAQGFSPGFLSQRESQFGPQYVSTLLASIPEPASFPLFAACGLALLPLTRRRRT